MNGRQLVKAQGRSRGAAPAAAREKVLLFRIGEAVYGIGIGGLWEVLPLDGVTGLPTPPHQVCTSLAYRGRTLPLIRLPELFEASGTAVPPSARVLLIHALGRPLGLLVDEVLEMTDIDPRRIGSVPSAATQLSPAFFRGIVRDSDRVVILLNGDGLAGMADVAAFDA
ncbi:MAG TPA: chemotaxis protein CheW [Candidatus Baltobacteraceae bacterium]|nr:chemotaxis protein CheW [Candidatus Baltobacteraceae bacterium]